MPADSNTKSSVTIILSNDVIFKSPVEGEPYTTSDKSVNADTSDEPPLPVPVIVTAPPDSVIVMKLPAVNARVSLVVKVLPPAVTPLQVLVSVTELVMVTAPPDSAIECLFQQ
jgi:hypothetical protein